MKKLLKISLTLLISIVMSVGIFKPEILMGTPASPAVGNWYQQFMPNLNGRTISDIFFIDSLTGWAVTPYRFQNDTAFVFKTTNSGDNWVVQNSRIGQFVGSNRVIFLNSNTGCGAGVSDLPSFSSILKTTNGGNNWSNIGIPTDPFTVRDFKVLSVDTIWAVSDNPLTGGVFFTSNGGASWIQQFSGGNQNPNKIYMYNARLGFMSNNSALPNIYRTTNGGLNWNLNVSGDRFNDMVFADTLTGWFGNSGDKIYKTTNGGNNWVTQYLPTGGIILTSNLNRFSALNKDTVWGAGGQLFYGSGRFRAMLYRTTNGGNNWLFNIPDTSFGIPALGFIQFINKNNAWSYNSFRGIHTTNGGDTTFLLGLQQTSNEVPKEFKLYQNFPNPFNPVTNIGFRISGFGLVTLKIFDITGREVITLINEELSPGEYKTDWNASAHSTGVYFYRLTVTTGKEVFTETKKMLMIK